MTRRRPIKHKQLVPPRRTDIRIRRRSDRTPTRRTTSLTTKLGEDSSRAHGVPVCRRRSCDEGYSHGAYCPVEEVDVDGVLTVVGPVGLGGVDCEVGLGTAFG